MSDEKRRNRLLHEESQTEPEKLRKGKEENTDDFFEKAKELFPSMNVAMNMMKLAQINQNRIEVEKDGRPLKEERRLDPDRILLRDRLQEKLGELLDEQQALVELYVKAARAAKDKEEEYRERIAELIEQTEKDKQLMELFRNL